MLLIVLDFLNIMSLKVFKKFKAKILISRKLEREKVIRDMRTFSKVTIAFSSIVVSLDFIHRNVEPLNVVGSFILYNMYYVQYSKPFKNLGNIISWSKK